ncbi:uncharacterized protein LY89DRAFT_671646 [Mollisia scopiformis]|uniref:SRR1-like domain-containing protein n=1 Tax=Mollisia scopiformis TaxID=149040 RepID=A0A194X281_MOLSC|nr:uncharacterized protein LY89DRAFT_671646 [Mollisia scopiformis]KUJ14283.1 hypothetical protein LY89DRAFT_671646 [Mollisia scopiformis]
MGAHDSNLYDGRLQFELSPSYLTTLDSNARNQNIVARANSLSDLDLMGELIDIFGDSAMNRLEAATIEGLMEKTISSFRDTDYCNALVDIIKTYSNVIRCRKIVAFGGGSMAQASTGSYRHNEAVLRIQTQHAALWIIRRTLESIHNHNIDIYLQDPDYTDNDLKAAARFNMKILNGRPGFQKGWLEIDESTLVVNLSTGFKYFWHLISEISRSIAMLSLGGIRVESSTGSSVHRLVVDYEKISLSNSDKDEKAPLGGLVLYARK